MVCKIIVLFKNTKVYVILANSVKLRLLLPKACSLVQLLPLHLFSYVTAQTNKKHYFCSKISF